MSVDRGNADDDLTITHREILIVSPRGVLPVPTASGYMVIGSGNSGNPGADVFGMTGGVGTNMKNGTFPANTGLPQGGNPGYAHIDVYGICSGGKNSATLTQQALVTILYTSPLAPRIFAPCHRMVLLAAFRAEPGVAVSMPR